MLSAKRARHFPAYARYEDAHPHDGHETTLDGLLDFIHSLRTPN